jgi:hypothetical protein
MGQRVRKLSVTRSQRGTSDAQYQRLIGIDARALDRKTGAAATIILPHAAPQSVNHRRLNHTVAVSNDKYYGHSHWVINANVGATANLLTWRARSPAALVREHRSGSRTH